MTLPQTGCVTSGVWFPVTTGEGTSFLKLENVLKPGHSKEVIYLLTVILSVFNVPGTVLALERK